MVAYKQDKEYMHYVGHLIATPKVQKLGKIPHHYHSTRLEHSIN
ncbi:HAD family hydrolase, partial [Streptococcus suis]|nr:HAD family hydrolase [Streptococcus suis]